MASRPFRSQASYDAERITRDMVVPFLRERGIYVEADLRKKVGSGESQIVDCRLSDGTVARMRVRLCWRRDGENPKEASYSAFQLRARTLDGDWEATLSHLAERDEREGVTHTLAIQRDGHAIAHAALIPREAVGPIWNEQRRVSSQLLVEGLIGTKNHATNGDSPTLWLKDERTASGHRVTDVLWEWPGVQDIALMGVASVGSDDDTFDDLPGMDYALLGRDGGQRVRTVRSEMSRDGAVRRAVLARARGRCERSSCGESRVYAGFLDVHHILGVERSDRVWNCVALCPNCHREAHFSPEAEAINEALLAYARGRQGEEHVEIVV